MIYREFGLHRLRKNPFILIYIICLIYVSFPNYYRFILNQFGEYLILLYLDDVLIVFSLSLYIYIYIYMRYV